MCVWVLFETCHTSRWWTFNTISLLQLHRCLQFLQPVQFPLLICFKSAPPLLSPEKVWAVFFSRDFVPQTPIYRSIFPKPTPDLMGLLQLWFAYLMSDILIKIVIYFYLMCWHYNSSFKDQILFFVVFWDIT